MSAGPEESVARVALAEPTIPPTATQRPTSTVAPTATIAPTRKPLTATPLATATVRLHANGRMPEGWRIYAGTSVPVSLNYHGDWAVQRESVSGEYFAVFSAPDGLSLLGVGPQEYLADVLAPMLKLSNVEIEQYFADAGMTEDSSMYDGCDDPISFDGVTRTAISQSLFITLNVRCDYQGTPTRMQISYGLVQDRGWGVITLAPSVDCDVTEATYFAPMIASLKFD
jgi:hypothetical protein